MEDGQTERQSLAGTGLRGTEDVALVTHRFLDSLDGTWQGSARSESPFHKHGMERRARERSRLALNRHRPREAEAM